MDNITNNYNRNKYTELKQQFVETTKYTNIYNTIFSKAVPHEEKWDKDLSEFKKNEIIEYLLSFKCQNKSTLRAYVSMIRNYCAYMSKAIEANISAWSEITSQDSDSCIYQSEEGKYMSRASLQEALDIIPNPMDKFFVLALFEGLRGDYLEEIWKLRMRDINPNTKEASLPTRRKLTISQELYDYAAISDVTDTYVSLRETTGWMNYKMIGDRIMKYRNNTILPDDYETQKVKLRDRLYYLRKYTGRKDLTIKILRHSGIIYNIKIEAAKAGISELEVFNRPVFYIISQRYNLKSAVALYKNEYTPYLND